MRKSIIMTTTILGISVMLSGCAFQATELKEDEQDQVAAYCAQIVSKHDEGPDKGLAVLPKTQQQETDSSAEITASDGSTDKTADTKKTDVSSDAKPVETKTFTEAVGIKGVSILYRDAKTAGGYSSNRSNCKTSPFTIVKKVFLQTSVALSIRYLRASPLFSTR